MDKPIGVTGEMIQTQESGQTTTTQAPKRKKQWIGRFLAIIREIIAVLFWVYVVTKVFIFDIDIFLVERILPNYEWILNYKFFILIGSIAVVWFFTKNVHILLWTLYILFYPAIILFWKIPFFVFKQRSWGLAIALFDATLSFFRSIRFSFIATSFFLVSLAVIFGFSDERLLWLAVAVLTITLLAVYIHRFLFVFRPSALYQFSKLIFIDFTKRMSSQSTLDRTMLNLPRESMNEMQLQTWTANLQQFVLNSFRLSMKMRTPS